jgi:DNA-binding Xre family transcriptional regulator
MEENGKKPPKRTNLKRLLQERRLQQKDLAKLADLETYQVSKYVNGKFDDMLFSTGVKICNALHCTFDEAFGDKVAEMKKELNEEEGA